ncbi:hypothetical protein ACDY96_02915 [Rhizobium mongolense]|uniref:hypothetical protein n=1 Tax=Rhizobium mongolense TaxID=57676 RepID=UPI003556E9AA
MRPRHCENAGTSHRPRLAFNLHIDLGKQRQDGFQHHARGATGSTLGAAVRQVQDNGQPFPQRVSVCCFYQRTPAFGLAQLARGDWLSIIRTGAAQYEFGAGKAEVSAILL